MTIKKEKKGHLTIYHVDKLITDDKMETLKNTNVNPSQIELIINDDADVYTQDGKLLLRFRKNKLTINKVNEFYDNIIKFAQTKTNNRGSTSGSKKKNIWNNPKIMTNIIGYFDTFSPKQKYLLKQQGKQILNVCKIVSDILILILITKNFIVVSYFIHVLIFIMDL